MKDSLRGAGLLRRLRAISGQEVLQELERTLSRPRYSLKPTPREDVAPRSDSGHGWAATGNQPSFELVSSRGALPTGWIWLHLPLRLEGAREDSPLLSVVGAQGTEVIRLPPPQDGLTRALVRLPEHVTSLRLGVPGRASRFELENLLAWEVGQSEATLRLALPLVTRLAADPRRVERAARKWWGIWREGGGQGVARALKDKSRGEQPLESYEGWIRQYDSLDDTDRAAIRRRLSGLTHQPLVSVVMPTYETPAPLLRLTLDSVSRQLYPNWELCIADDASPSPHVRAILEEYARRDPRIRYVVRPRNGHISAASNSALELARGEFIALLDHDDELPEHALYHVIEELNAHPDADIVYSDEDKLDERGRRFDPYFKPDWNLELFRSQNLISHLGVYRASLVREVGGFREGLEGSQDYDLALRVVERIPASHIRHISRVLYHWRAIPGSTALNVGEKDYAGRAARRALEEHYTRVTGGTVRYVPGVHGALHGSVYPVPEPRPLVSLLLATRDGGERLRRFIESLRRHGTWAPLELVLVDNQSRDPRTREYLAELEREGARLLVTERVLDSASLLNLAASRAQGTVLAFLDEGLEVLTPRWLEELVAHALRDDVGAVGARLQAPDGTIHHAGYLLGVGPEGVADAAHRGLPPDALGYFGRALLPQEFSAISTACLVMRRSVFEEAGGLDASHLPGAHFDVDLCLRLRERGYRIVWNPAARLVWHDASTSASQVETAYMRARWASALEADAFHSPNLTRGRGDFSLAWPPRVMPPWRA
ncbi:MAG: glycosyltransferase [Cystobacter sp.]